MNQDLHHTDDDEFKGLLQGYSPWSVLGWILLFTVCLIFLGRRSMLGTTAGDFDDPGGTIEALETLEAAVKDPAERVIVFLGDSVMRGNVLREAGFSSEETPAWWARRLSRASVTFYDLSLDGMLPCDMEVLLDRLRKLDPEGRVEVAIQLSPRFLSADYADKDNAHARTWLKEMAEKAGPGALDDLRLTRHRLGLQMLRRNVGAPLRRPEHALLAGPFMRQDPERQLRVARHFLEADIGTDNVQVAALSRMHEELRRSGRKTLFFASPVNPRAFGVGGHDIVTTQLIFSLMLDHADKKQPPAVRFQNFDDDAFKQADFIDHCHLVPDANRRLALRLLNSLAVPVEEHAVRRSVEHYVRSTALPQDGFGLEAGIHRVEHACFVGPERILMSSLHRQRTLLRYWNTERKALATLDTSAFGSTRVKWLHPRDDNRALVFLDDGRVWEWQPGHGLGEVRGSPFPWSDEELIVTGRGPRLVVHGRRTRAVWSADLEAGTVKQHARVPAEQVIHSLALAPEDLLYVLSARADSRPFACSLNSLPLDDFLGGKLGRLETYFSNPQQLAVEAWSAIHASEGLAQLKPDKNKIPVAWARRVHVARPPHRLIIEAPTYRASRNDSITTWPVADTTTLWSIDTHARVAYALLRPSEAGGAVDERTNFPLPPGRVFAVHGASGRVFGNWNGWRLFETSDIMRFNWKYGVPPDKLADSVTAKGYTYRTRPSHSWRAGFFGSSVIGGSWRRDNAGVGGLMMSVSMARSFTREAASLRDGAPYSIEGLDFSLARTDLIGMYGALLSLDPREINAAVFCIDRSTLGEPDRAADDGGMSIVERWPSIIRDENGRPLIDRVRGFLPAVRLGKPAPASADRAEIIRSAIHEIVTFARDRDITPVFVDLSQLDTSELKTDRPPTAGRPGDLAHLESALRELDVPLYRADELSGNEMIDQMPHGFIKDRHLRRRFLSGMGRAAVRFLRPMAESWAFRMEAAEARKARAIADAGMPAPPPPRLPGPGLDELVAARFHVRPASTSLRIGPTTLLTVDLRQEGTADSPWRQALAAFGLRAPGAAPSGRDVRIDVIRYSRYDEYGTGVRGTRSVLGRFVIRAEDLPAAAAACKESVPQQQPSWLRTL